MRNPHAGEPFDADDATIAAALEDVSTPALLCSLVLREYDGDLAAAAERLAHEWSFDVVAVRAAMEAWVADWRKVGLVTTQQADGHPA